MDIRKIETIKDGDKAIGSRHRVKIVKNKISAPFRLAEFDVFGTGISREGGIMDVGVEMGVISKSGAFYRYGEEMMGQGKAASMDYLKENPQVSKEIVSKIMAQNKDGRAPLVVGSDEDGEETPDDDNRPQW